MNEKPEMIPSRSPVLVLFANLKGNLGDFAILHAMLEEIARRHPGSPVHVSSHGQHKVDERRFKAFLAMPHPPFEYRGKTPFVRIGRLWSILKRLGLSAQVSDRCIARLEKEYGKKPLFSKVEDYEAIFFAGGEQWSGFSNGITMLSVLSALIGRNPNLFIFPFSVKGKLVEMHKLSRLARCFGAFKGRVLTRDSHSHKTVRKFHPAVISGVDCVFSLGDSVSIPSKADGDGKQVILAVTNSPGSRNPAMKAVFAKLEAEGYRVKLLSSCEHEDREDHLFISGDPSKCLFPETWQETVRLLAEADVVVTNRLHCLIFSFFSAASVVPLLDREKLLGVFKDADLPLGLREIGELDGRMIEQIKDAGPEIRKRITAYRERIEPMVMFPEAVR